MELAERLREKCKHEVVRWRDAISQHWHALHLQSQLCLARLRETTACPYPPPTPICEGTARLDVLCLIGNVSKPQASIWQLWTSGLSGWKCSNCVNYKTKCLCNTWCGPIDRTWLTSMCKHYTHLESQSTPPTDKQLTIKHFLSQLLHFAKSKQFLLAKFSIRIVWWINCLVNLIK